MPPKIMPHHSDPDDLWTIKLRDYQVRALQTILQEAKANIVTYNKNWLPARLAATVVDGLIEHLMDVCG